MSGSTLNHKLHAPPSSLARLSAPTIRHPLRSESREALVSRLEGTHLFSGAG
jgi:hypothetical protein